MFQKFMLVEIELERFKDIVISVIVGNILSFNKQ